MDPPASADLPSPVRGYTFLKEIGSGGTSRVFLVNSEKFNQVFVAKTLNLTPREMNVNWRAVTAEVTALARLNYPNVIRLYDHFRTETMFVIILEYCPGGSLSQMIPAKGMSIDDWRQTARDLTSTLAFCHYHNIAHRDLKPSNILIDGYGRIKLADFGLSIWATKNTFQHSCCGSLTYIAPEVLNRQTNSPFAADIWSLGVVFLVMAQGVSPWRAKDAEGVKELIRSGMYWIDPALDPEIRTLIECMIVMDPSQRLSIDEVLRCGLFDDLETSGSHRMKKAGSVRKCDDRLKIEGPLKLWRSVNVMQSANLHGGIKLGASKQLTARKSCVAKRHSFCE